MIVTYILSVCLMILLLYLLKHTLVRDWVGLGKPVWKPLKLRRWTIALMILAVSMPLANVVAYSVVIAVLCIDNSFKFDIDNFFTRWWNRVTKWFDQEI